jgi:hypothetical protein
MSDRKKPAQKKPTKKKRKVSNKKVSKKPKKAKENTPPKEPVWKIRPHVLGPDPDKFYSGQHVWIRSLDEYWAARIESMPAKCDGVVKVWWLGPDNKQVLTGAWNLLVHKVTRKPLFGRVPLLSVFSVIKFESGNILGNNHPGTPAPVPPEPESSGESGSDDDLVNDDYVPENLRPRDFFYAQLLSVEPNWKKRYIYHTIHTYTHTHNYTHTQTHTYTHTHAHTHRSDRSLELDIAFGLSRNRKNLPMEGGTVQEAETWYNNLKIKN